MAAAESASTVPPEAKRRASHGVGREEPRRDDRDGPEDRLLFPLFWN